MWQAFIEIGLVVVGAMVIAVLGLGLVALWIRQSNKRLERQIAEAQQQCMEETQRPLVEHASK